MQPETLVLLGTAASIGFIHTLIGPDHYLPFVVMSKARDWSTRKTMWLTFLCGVGHVLSSSVLGFIGIGLGIAVGNLEAIEAIRGETASWLLLAFGLVYTIWGIRRAVRNKPHTHIHAHAVGEPHDHEHGHTGEHSHVHGEARRSITPWALFIVFVLGPCEPLIPLLMYPAATGRILDVAIVAGVFGGVTITTMMSIVFLAQRGLMKLSFHKLERYAHALAGFAIFASGGAMKLFGL